MRLAIVHVSIHHQNTAMVAEVMAQSIGADLLTVAEAIDRADEHWDLMGLGSGIFFGSHHRSLLRFAQQWRCPPKSCFLFSTAGLPSFGSLWHRSLRKIVMGQGIPILDEACFPGWDTVGPLKWIGGIQRGRPNQLDLERASSFAKNVVARRDKEKLPNSLSSKATDSVKNGYSTVGKW